MGWKKAIDGWVREVASALERIADAVEELGHAVADLSEESELVPAKVPIDPHATWRCVHCAAPVEQHNIIEMAGRPPELRCPKPVPDITA